jgi:hypothetical protein
MDILCKPILRRATLRIGSPVLEIGRRRREALLIGSPVFTPLIVVISIVVAIWVYRRIRLPKLG